jgi:TRAP transporter TAXI family solute receptor
MKVEKVASIDHSRAHIHRNFKEKAKPRYRLGRFVLSILLVLFLISTANAKDQFIRIASGLAGTYPIVGAKTAELINQYVPGVKASTIMLGAAAGNMRIQKGEAEIAVNYSFNSKQLFDGKGPSGISAPNLRHLMTLYGSAYQPISVAKSGVTSLYQLKEKPYRVWGASTASVFKPLFIAALQAHGITEADVRKVGGVVEAFGYGQTIEAIQDGRLDVSFYSGPVPYQLLQQIAKRPGFNLIGFDDQSIAKMQEILPGTGKTTVKAGSYPGQTEDKVLPYLVNEFQISSKVPDDLAYRIVKVLVEHYKEYHGLFAGSEQITPDVLLTNYAIPVHPGAARYYKEIGKMK